MAGRHEKSNSAMNPTNPQIFFLIFVCLWFAVSFVIAQLSGWAQLSRYYRSETQFEGEPWKFRSCQARWMTHYNNCITVGANAQGLYVAIFLLFRSGHPPLLVPWHNITVRRGKTLFWDWTEFRFEQTPGVWLKFYGGLGEEICRAAGPAWPGSSDQNGNAISK